MSGMGWSVLTVHDAQRQRTTALHTLPHNRRRKDNAVPGSARRQQEEPSKEQVADGAHRQPPCGEAARPKCEQ